MKSIRMTANGQNGIDQKCSFDNAMEIVGYGKYSIALLVTCCLLILMMYVDIFGFSVMMPAVACDMELTTAQQGLLSAVPLVGVMVSSYAWGLCADMLGRRRTLLCAMPVGVLLNLAASLAPGYAALAVLKFFSGSFISSANAAAFVLLGECVPSRHRSRNMFLMATTTTFSQFVISILALPIFKLHVHAEIPWLGLQYRPWRLLMQVLCLPGIIGCLLAIFMQESPKFLLSRGKDERAIEALKIMYRMNNSSTMKTFPINQVVLEDELINTTENVSFLHRMWNQTVPLFKPPLLVNSMKLYFLLMCAFMTSTGYTMWVPTMINAYFTGNEVMGKTFCDVASSATGPKNSTTSDCDNTIKPMALYGTMVYSIIPGCLTIILSFIVGPLGKRRTTNLVFFVSLLCGSLLIFVRVPLLSILMFFMFLYVSLVLGTVNTYLVELNPTQLRGMATCLSVVVARGFGFIGVQLIAVLVGDYCTPMLGGFVVLVACGLAVSLLLPAEEQKKHFSDAIKISTVSSTVVEPSTEIQRL